MKAHRQIVGLLFPLLPALAWSADYYVTPNGTGDYLSPTTPGGSVSYAVHTLAAAGDTIHLAVGDYDLTGQYPAAGTEETGCIPLDARPFVAEVGPNQDAYSLDPNSACVDKAFALDWMAGAVDILGNRRVFNNVPDIGACEAFWRRGFLLMFR